MQLRRLAAGLAALLTAHQAIAGCTLPADTTNRVGRAVEFMAYWTPAQYAALSSSLRDYIWDARAAGSPTQPLRLPSGVFSSAYFAMRQVFQYAYAVDDTRSFSACDQLTWTTSPLCTYAWWMSNHPSWIIRRGDRATPAWEFQSTVAQGAKVTAATNGATAAGNNTLHFASTPATVVAGMQIADITAAGAVPLGLKVQSTTATTVIMTGNAAGAGVGSGDTIAFIVPGSGITSSTTAAGNAVLHFTAGATFPPNVAAGQYAVDITTASVLPSGTKVQSADPAAGTVTLDTNAAGGGVASGDLIDFVNIATVTTTSVDISNPDVRTWMQNVAGHLLSFGFSGLSIDNVADRNDWDMEGVCSAAIPLDAANNPIGDCAANGGTWTALYPPPQSQPDSPLDDGQFVTDQVTWLTQLTAYVHGLDKCTTGNITYDPRSLSAKAAHDAAAVALIGAVDLWYNEGAGGMGDSVPSSGLIGGSTISATISGTLAAKSTTVTLTGTPSVTFADGAPLSIAGAGPNGQTYLGLEVGAPSGNTITISPATSTAVSNPTVVQTTDYAQNQAGVGWINLYNFTTALNGGLGVPEIYEDSLFPLNTPIREVVDWAVATNLLMKPVSNAHTYITWYFDGGNGHGVADYDDGSVGGGWPEFWWQHGAPTEATQTDGHLYWRHFANGLVILNPSAIHFSFDFGATRYHGFDGFRYPEAPSVSTRYFMQPYSALLLMSGDGPGPVIPATVQ